MQKLASDMNFAKKEYEKQQKKVHDSIKLYWRKYEFVLNNMVSEFNARIKSDLPAIKKFDSAYYVTRAKEVMDENRDLVDFFDKLNFFGLSKYRTTNVYLKMQFPDWYDAADIIEWHSSVFYWRFTTLGTNVIIVRLKVLHIPDDQRTFDYQTQSMQCVIEYLDMQLNSVFEHIANYDFMLNNIIYSYLFKFSLDEDEKD